MVKLKLLVSKLFPRSSKIGAMSRWRDKSKHFQNLREDRTYAISKYVCVAQQIYKRFPRLGLPLSLSDHYSLFRYSIPSRCSEYNLFSGCTVRRPSFLPSLFLQSRIIPQITCLLDRPNSPTVPSPPHRDVLRSIFASSIAPLESSLNHRDDFLSLLSPSFSFPFRSARTTLNAFVRFIIPTEGRISFPKLSYCRGEISVTNHRGTFLETPR